MINKDKLLLYKLCRAILDWSITANESPVFVELAREHMCSMDKIPTDE